MRLFRQSYNLFLLLYLALLLTTIGGIPQSLVAERIKVGVPTSLTGDAANYGIDVRNALTFANQRFFNNRYQFIFEDDGCKAKTAIAAANKLIAVDQVKYVLGIACNESLLASAPIYEKHQVLVMTSTATSGDAGKLGEYIFSLFPPDQLAAAKLFEYLIQQKIASLAVYTEENQFPLLIRNSLQKLNAGRQLELTEASWLTGEYDHKAALIKLLQKKPAAFLINSNSELSYVEVLKSLRRYHYQGLVLALYHPASAVSIENLGPLNDGVVLVNVPQILSLTDTAGQEIYQEFLKQYGKPNSIDLGVAIAIDSLSILDQALDSKEAPEQHIRSHTFNGLLRNVSFDSDSVIKGVNFELQQMKQGQAVPIL